LRANDTWVHTWTDKKSCLHLFHLHFHKTLVSIRWLIARGIGVWCLKSWLLQTVNIHPLRASPTVLTMWLQTVKFIARKSKCAGLAQEISFSAPNSCSLLWLVKGATELCTSKKECNKLYLTAAQYFWLFDHNDWSRWFAISSPHIYAVPVLLVGLPKKNTANLRREILSSSGDALITCSPSHKNLLKWLTFRSKAAKTTHELHPLINLGCKITQLHPVRTGTNIQYINE
jgi:hypothetical protein